MIFVQYENLNRISVKVSPMQADTANSWEIMRYAWNADARDSNIYVHARKIRYKYLYSTKNFYSVDATANKPIGISLCQCTYSFDFISMLWQRVQLYIVPMYWNESHGNEQSLKIDEKCWNQHFFLVSLFRKKFQVQSDKNQTNQCQSGTRICLRKYS